LKIKKLRHFDNLKINVVKENVGKVKKIEQWKRKMEKIKK
jgi:hypothetical protein